MSISQNFPSTRPSLNLNFARSQKLDPRITFTRSSTATYTGGDGLIKSAATDTPRFDFNATTGDCLGLLIEESRTNLIGYSGIPSANWAALNSAVITNNSSTSPDGTTNATQIAGAASVASGVFVTFSLTSGTAYTYSLFVKAVSGSNTIYFGTDSGTTATVQINTSTGVASLNSGSPTNITSTSYPNGWYRISFTFTAGATATHSFVIYNLTANVNTWLAYGAQVEAGAFPTSYIPTVASTVTRSADNASITGTNFSSFYNPSEGNVTCSGRFLYINPLTYGQALWAIGDSSTFNESMYLVNDSGSTGITFNMFDGGVNQFVVGSSTITAGSFNKISVSYKTNDSAASFNSSTPTTDTSCTLPTVNSLKIGNTSWGTFNPLNGHISQLSYYPVRLSNSQLQNLTK